MTWQSFCRELENKSRNHGFKTLANAELKKNSILFNIHEIKEQALKRSLQKSGIKEEHIKKIQEFDDKIGRERHDRIKVEANLAGMPINRRGILYRNDFHSVRMDSLLPATFREELKKQAEELKNNLIPEEKKEELAKRSKRNEEQIKGVWETERMRYLQYLEIMTHAEEDMNFIDELAETHGVIVEPKLQFHEGRLKLALEQFK
ncbi:MAG: hypothetical protein QXR53_01505 [Candidatus Norongarragalinales archaeon]